MIQTLPVLENVRIASPCYASWDAMKGDDRVRFCGDCRLNVYNLSEMSRPEAEKLLQMHEGHLCIRLYKRADGTIITKDCPVGLRAIRLRLAWLGACVAAGFALVASHVLGRRSLVLPETTLPPPVAVADPAPVHMQGAPTPGFQPGFLQEPEKATVKPERAEASMGGARCGD